MSLFPVLKLLLILFSLPDIARSQPRLSRLAAALQALEMRLPQDAVDVQIAGGRVARVTAAEGATRSHGAAAAAGAARRVLQTAVAGAVGPLRQNRTLSIRDALCNSCVIATEPFISAHFFPPFHV